MGHALLPQVAAAPAVVAPVVTKKVVQVAKPVVSYHGLTTPLVHSSPVTYTTGYPYVNTHLMGKREAEAEADPALLYGNFYNTGYHGVYNGLYNHGVYSAPLTYTHHAAAVPVVKKVEVTAPVVTKTAVAPVVSYGYPYAYNTHLVAKREAEAEADPALLYGNFYNTGYHGVYNGLYNHGIYSAPLTY